MPGGHLADLGFIIMSHWYFNGFHDCGHASATHLLTDKSFHALSIAHLLGQCRLHRGEKTCLWGF